MSLDTKVPDAQGEANEGDGRRALPWLVAAVALGLGIVLYASFWPNARHLWWGFLHDRHAHYEFGVNLAMDVRHGNLRGLVHHLDGARVWGPMHGLALGLVQLVVGPDHRFAILPSWLAWMGSAVLIFLLTRRLLPEGGDVAGVLASCLLLLSPAHRAFATDVMIESLGAALTLLCLLRYLIAVQDDAPTRWRWFALSLTVLFLTKSNYWLIVMLGLGLGECLRHTPLLLAWARAALAGLPVRDVLVRQLRSPWNYLIGGLLGVALAIVLSGGTVLEVGSLRISVSRAHNVVHVAYFLALVRVLLWWRRAQVSAWLAAGQPVLRSLAYWHAWPVALYFLLPKRLGCFLWFVSPANSSPTSDSRGLSDGIPYYFTAFQGEYHVFAWLAVPVLVLVAVAFAALPRWRAGASAVACFLSVAALLTCQHPMLKNRHAHSWIALLWVFAAAGLIHVIHRLLPTLPRWRSALAWSSCALVASGHGGHWLEPGRAQEAGVKHRMPSLLTFTESFMPAVRDARHCTILCNVYSPFVCSWTFQEACRHQRFATEIKGLRDDESGRVLPAWGAKGQSDAVLLIEVDENSSLAVGAKDELGLDLAPVSRYLGAQAGFHRQADWQLPQSVHVTLWTRQPQPF